MEKPKKSMSDCGHAPTLSSIAREEARLAFNNKLISHNQYAVRVAEYAPAYFSFSPITGEDVENCADLLCRNECANRKRIERYVIKGEKFDKNLVPALIKALPEPRRSIAKQRIMALLDDSSDEIFDFTSLGQASIKEASEATIAIATCADLATLAKELQESIDAQQAMLDVTLSMLAGGQS